MFLVALLANSNSIKKFELDIEFEYDFLLFGIVSPEKPYRLAWQINHKHPYNFERAEDYEVRLNDKPCSFSRFDFKHDENHTGYILLANKEEGAFLLPELRNFDYLLLVSGALDFFDELTLKQDIGAVTSVQIIYAVDINTLKSKQNLVYAY